MNKGLMKELAKSFNDMVGQIDRAEALQEEVDAMRVTLKDKDIRIHQVEEMVSSLTEKTKALLAENESLQKEIKQVRDSARHYQNCYCNVQERAVNLLTERDEMKAKITEMSKNRYSPIVENEVYYSRIAGSQIVDREIIKTSNSDEFKRVIDNLQHMLKEDFVLLCAKFPEKDIKARVEIMVVQ